MLYRRGRVVCSKEEEEEEEEVVEWCVEEEVWFGRGGSFYSPRMDSE